MCWPRSTRSSPSRNSAAGLWKGAGLTSSTARDRADQITGLAAIVNNDAGQPIVTNFGDQHPGLTSVLVKYTYNGDSDLNEQVDAFDYFHIDQGYRLQGDPTYRNYRSGDVNYSGAIDADDYYLIDRAFIHQSGALAAGISEPPLQAAAAPAASQSAPAKPQTPFASADTTAPAAASSAVTSIWCTQTIKDDESALDLVLEIGRAEDAPLLA